MQSSKKIHAWAPMKVPLYRHSELIVNYNIGLKTLLQQSLSEPKFYGDLVYKFT